MVTLRPVEVSDKYCFEKWWRDKQLIALTSGDYTELSDNQIEEYFQNILPQFDRVDYMIEVDGVTIGHINAAKRQGDWWETQIVIGEKDYWGKGYGSSAVTALLARLKSQGITKVYLEVRPENIRAIRAYEKCGFTEVSRVRHDNIHQPETIRMELEI